MTSFIPTILSRADFLRNTFPVSDDLLYEDNNAKSIWVQDVKCIMHAELSEMRGIMVGK